MTIVCWLRNVDTEPHGESRRFAILNLVEGSVVQYVEGESVRIALVADRELVRPYRPDAELPFDQLGCEREQF